MLYTNKEAEVLINYYREKVLGRELENSFSRKIDIVEMKELENYKFLVRAGFFEDSIFIYEEIGRLSKRFSLISPEDVLKDSNF